MCTMIAATLISAGVSAAGAMMQSQQAAAQMQMQADMHKRQAFLERESGAHEAELATRQGERIAGAQRAGLAASGIDLGTGSALDSQVDSAIEVQRDVDAIRWNANIKADNEKYKAKEAKYNAKQEKKAGYLNAASSLAPILGMEIPGAAKIGGWFG